MKILIITLCGNYNLGNRLQHYAIQEVLKKKGHTVYSINTFKNKITVKRLIKKVLSIIADKEYKTYFKREILFNEFNEKYIDSQFIMPINKVFSMDWEEYDAAIVGSDQVWHNWENDAKELDYYYLMFIDHKKRISYAPSFGFGKFPIKDIDIHKKGLDEMRFLSCREKTGCTMINNLTGRNAENVMDPTLLLSSNEWQQIAKKPEFELPERYMLVYFLGEITEQYRKFMDKLTRLYCVQVINIYDKKQYDYYQVDPLRFLYLIKHAVLICTDSFHGTVFSIIYEKQFITFLRDISIYNASSDRIIDLLERVGLGDHIFCEDMDICKNTDYQMVNEILNDWKKTSLLYLDKAISRVTDDFTKCRY